MNGYWLRTTCLSRGICFAASLLVLGACGQGKFSEDFSAEIQRDCIETVGCTQMGQVEGCITAVGDSLNGARTSQQQFFVDAVYRCEGSRMCDWVTCTQSTNATGYAATHLSQITHDCQQRAMCRISSGQPVTQDSVNDCIQQTGNNLNANPTEQANFDARNARCAGQAGCSWGACQ
jgi:2-oxoglutarate dehydrogenase complex dehydrogenase (E1) component-like enzyme